MRAIQRMLKQGGEMLNRLPTNARLLIGSMMVILAMGLLLVSQYAGRSTMAPLGLPDATEVRAAAVRYLDLARIAYEDRGNDIYVPVDSRFSVLGQLNEQQIVAANEIDFNALIDRSSNPFVGREQSRQMWLTAKMNVLGAMIASRQDVARARVVIDEPPGATGMGRAYVAPTATVTVSMRGSTMTQDVADAIGRTVAGAHAGLKPENITVMDNSSGRSFIPRGGEALAGGTYLETKDSIEKHYRVMIENAMAHIPGVTVSVNAVVRNTQEVRNKRTVDDPKIGPRSSETRDVNSTNTSRGGEAGVRPNTGQAIAGSGQGSQMTESMSREQLESRFGGGDSLVKDPTGYPLQINALVGIPRSFFVRLFQIDAGDDAAEPDAAQLDALVQQETQRWQTFLEPLIKTEGLEGAAPGTVLVSMVHDFNTPAVGDVEAAALASGGMGDLLGDGMLQNIGLAALALVSLFMMFMMVRRVNSREPLPTAAELVGIPPALSAAESDLVGEAEEGGAVLEGIELDDGAMKTSQLIQQIEEMVKASPDEAAGLVRRWMNHDG